MLLCTETSDSKNECGKEGKPVTEANRHQGRSLVKAIKMALQDTFAHGRGSPAWPFSTEGCSATRFPIVLGEGPSRWGRVHSSVRWRSGESGDGRTLIFRYRPSKSSAAEREPS
jgi:hypothetical protein